MNEQDFNPKTMDDAERDKRRRESMARDIQQISPVLRSIGALLIYVFRRQSVDVGVSDAYGRADLFIEQLLKDLSE